MCTRCTVCNLHKNPARISIRQTRKKTHLPDTENYAHKQLIVCRFILTLNPLCRMVGA